MHKCNALKICFCPPDLKADNCLWHQVTLKIKARVRLRYPILSTYFHEIKGSTKDPCAFKNAEAEEQAEINLAKIEMPIVLSLRPN